MFNDSDFNETNIKNYFENCLRKVKENPLSVAVISLKIFNKILITILRSYKTKRKYQLAVEVINKYWQNFIDLLLQQIFFFYLERTVSENF